MKNSEFLKLTKKYLWDGDTSGNGFGNRLNNEKYICVSLYYTSREVYTDSGRLITNELKDWIGHILSIGEYGYINTYTTWLQTYYPELYKTMTKKDIQEGRHQWLDWMITYWEEKGN